MNVTIVNGTMPMTEALKYIYQIKQKNPDKELTEVVLTIDGDYVDVKYEFKTVPFERIRRITGYLVGSLDNFNDAKRAEVEARVKHDLSGTLLCI